MPVRINSLLRQYIEEIGEIYGEHLKSVILYCSYSREDFRPESDIDIMILLDLSDMEICEYRKQLSWITYDFYEEHDIDIKPIAKSEAHYKKWRNAYLFYASVKREGVELYGTA